MTGGWDGVVDLHDWEMEVDGEEWRWGEGLAYERAGGAGVGVEFGEGVGAELWCVGGFRQVYAEVRREQGRERGWWFGCVGVLAG